MTLKEQNDFYRKAWLGRKDGKDMPQKETCLGEDSSHNRKFRNFRAIVDDALRPHKPRYFHLVDFTKYPADFTKQNNPCHP